MGQFLTCRPEFADLWFKSNIIKLYSEVKFITYIDIILMYNCNRGSGGSKWTHTVGGFPHSTRSDAILTLGGFPGGTVVENPPANAGVMGSSCGP